MYHLLSWDIFAQTHALTQINHAYHEIDIFAYVFKSTMFFMNNLCKMTIKHVFIHGGYQIDHVFHGLFISNPPKYLPTKNPFWWKAQKHGLIAPVHSIKMGTQICRLKRKIFGQLQVYVTLTTTPYNVCVNQHNSHQLNPNKNERKRNSTSMQASTDSILPYHHRKSCFHKGTASPSSSPLLLIWMNGGWV